MRLLNEARISGEGRNSISMIITAMATLCSAIGALALVVSNNLFDPFLEDEDYPGKR